MEHASSGSDDAWISTRGATPTSYIILRASFLHDLLFVNSETDLKLIVISPRQMKVQKYTSLAQKINADFLCDEG